MFWSSQDRLIILLGKPRGLVPYRRQPADGQLLLKSQNPPKNLNNYNRLNCISPGSCAQPVLMWYCLCINTR